MSTKDSVTSSSGLKTDVTASEISQENDDFCKSRCKDCQEEQEAATTTAPPTSSTPATTPAATVDAAGTAEDQVALNAGEGDGFYVDKEEFLKAVRILLQYGRLVLVGPTGSGKTYFAYALLQWFRQRGYLPKFKLNFCAICRDNLVKEDVGPKRILLVEKFSYELRGTSEMLHEFTSFFFNTQRVWNRRLWNCLVIATIYPQIFQDFESSGTSSDSRVLTYPQVVMRMTQDPRNPSLRYVPTVNTILPFITRVLRDRENGNTFSCLLTLAMGGTTSFVYHIKEIQEELVRLGYGTTVSCHSLQILKDHMQDILFHPRQSGFVSRDTYDAAGLALGMNGAMGLLLRVCDAKFLVEHVRLDEDAKASQMVLVIPKNRSLQRRLMVERMYKLIVNKGGGRELGQHPSLSYAEVVQEFAEYCSGQQDYAERLTTMVDSDFKLPLLYWSLWTPSPHLTQWCLEVMAQHVRNGTDLSAAVLASLLGCILLTQSGSSVLSSVKDFVKELYHLHFQPEETIVNLTLPVPRCNTQDSIVRLEQVKTHVQSGLWYLHDPILPIHRGLLSLTVSKEAIKVDMSRDNWYLILRLLTDTDQEEKDQLGNTLLHIAVHTADVATLKMIVRSGASLTARNKEGLTPPRIAAKKKKNKGRRTGPAQETNSKHLLSAARGGDLVTFKVLLCQGTILQMQDGEKNTPLHLASHGGHADMVSLMLKQSASVDAQNAEGQTPLYNSCLAGHVDVAKLLLGCGADINARNGPGEMTALHAACQFRHCEVVSLLLHHHADVDMRDSKRRTPADIVRQMGYQDPVFRLLFKRIMER